MSILCVGWLVSTNIMITPTITTKNITIIPNITSNTKFPKIYFVTYSGVFGYLMVTVLVGFIEVFVIIFVDVVQVLLVLVKVVMVVYISCGGDCNSYGGGD